jgi:hypothetical protein
MKLYCRLVSTGNFFEGAYRASDNAPCRFGIIIQSSVFGTDILLNGIREKDVDMN